MPEATLVDVREAKAILDMLIDNDTDYEVKDRLNEAGYHPDDAEDLVEAGRRMLSIANNYQ